MDNEKHTHTHTHTHTIVRLQKVSCECWNCIPYSPCCTVPGAISPTCRAKTLALASPHLTWVVIEWGREQWWSKAVFRPKPNAAVMMHGYVCGSRESFSQRMINVIYNVRSCHKWMKMQFWPQMFPVTPLSPNNCIITAHNSVAQVIHLDILHSYKYFQTRDYGIQYVNLKSGFGSWSLRGSISHW